MPGTAPPPTVASTSAPPPSAVPPSTAPAESTGAARATPSTPKPAAAAASGPLLSTVLASLPFKQGERLEYQVKYGFLGVGNAALEVLGVEDIRGTPTVHTVFSVSGGLRVYRVKDRYESWFDPRDFSTLRAVQDIDEGSYEKERTYQMFPDRRVFIENDKPEEPSAPEPLDEGSFLFFLRSIPLEVGKTYTFDRYFRPDRNPVKVIVLRKERVKVPAGQFNTIVVRPVIRTKGIFGEGGNAQVWFTDDSARTLVQLKSSLKFGSLNLYLKNLRPGTSWGAR